MSTLAQRIARDGVDPSFVRHDRRRRSRALPTRISERLFGESMLGTWFVTAVLVLLGLLLVRPLVMSTLSWHRTASLLADRRAEVGALRARHTALKEQLAYFGTDAFLAERAREYGLIRAGETPFVIREYTRGNGGARFSLDRATAHIGSFPKVSSSTTPAQAGASTPGTATTVAATTTTSAAQTAPLSSTSE
jgi:cell division protein FtsB